MLLVSKMWKSPCDIFTMCLVKFEISTMWRLQCNFPLNGKNVLKFSTKLEVKWFLCKVRWKKNYVYSVESFHNMERTLWYLSQCGKYN